LGKISEKNQKFVKNFYALELQKKKEQNLYRKLSESDIIDSVTIKRGRKSLISFASNDYFGLSQNSLVKKAALDAIKKFGVGAGASRYVTGNNSLYTKLEKQIAKIKNCQDAIVFTSGYASSIGVIPALVGEGDLIIADRLIHSSLIDGAKLSGAKLMRFLHNDVLHAKEILEENRSKFKKCLIITETIFSMDGDIGEVKELLKLAEKFDAFLISDDAHGLFSSCHVERSETSHNVLRDPSAKLQDDRLVIMGTLSKAVGAVGGYVAGEKIIIDYLRNFAKSQIYSTALPPAILASAIASLKIIEKKNLGKKTLENAQHFCELMNLPKPQSAIVPIIIGNALATLKIAKKLEEKGFLVGAIRYPTVEKNKARLRITFSSEHKKSQIKNLVRILQNLSYEKSEK
jgi:8-amino-7-oxononanoate synthase